MKMMIERKAGINDKKGEWKDDGRAQILKKTKECGDGKKGVWEGK